MQEKDANFVTSQNPSYYTNETRYLDTFELSVPLQSLPTCLLTRILTCLLNYFLIHSYTQLVKYKHTKLKFNITAYQDITIYYYALSL